MYSPKDALALGRVGGGGGESCQEDACMCPYGLFYVIGAQLCLVLLYWWYITLFFFLMCRVVPRKIT